MSKKEICFIAQFPPPMHGLSKAVETLYNSELNVALNPDGEFEFEKVDITNNKDFIKNLLKISKSKADLFYFTISQTKGGNLRDLVIFKLLELQHKKCLIHLHGGYYRQLVDNDMAGWQRKVNYKATSFDSIALTASCYSYHTLEDGEQPNKGIQLMWCILLILLPIALLFAESSMNNLQSVSIVAAFPIGVVIVMIAVSFMKDAKKYMESLEESAKEKVRIN